MARLAKNTFLYTIGNVIPKAANFILLPIYTLYLSPHDYGIISSVQAISQILLVFFSLSFGASVFRLYYDYKTLEEQKAFFGTLFLSTGIISILFLILLLIFRNFVQQIYSSIPFNPFFLYVILTVFTTNFFDLPQKYLMLQDKAGMYILLAIIRFSLNAALILWFIINKNEGAVGFLKAGLICSVILLPVYWGVTYKMISFKFSFSIFKSILMFSLPIIPTLLSAWVLDLSDRIFIERYFSLEDVGIYSLAYTVAGIVLIVSSSFDMAYRPLFFKFSNSENEKDGKAKIFKYNYIFLLAFILFSFLCAFFAREIIILLFDVKYKDVFLYVPIIILSYLFSVAGALIARFFEQSKKVKVNMYIYLGIACLNIILNFVFIPIYGGYGAAASTVVSLMVGFFIGYFYARKNCYFVPFNWGKLLPIGGVLFFIQIVFQYWILIENIYYSFALKLVICIILFIVFFLGNYKDLKTILPKSLSERS